jgi:hypothetical protein
MTIVAVRCSRALSALLAAFLTISHPFATSSRRRGQLREYSCQLIFSIHFASTFRGVQFKRELQGSAEAASQQADYEIAHVRAEPHQAQAGRKLLI